jgi:2-polyprenyl-3-methyl-5-hydroxy-6-metoxy-1,4-benzoquinol methylase
MLEVAQRKLARFGARFEARVADVTELARQQPKHYQVALCARVLMHFPLAEQVKFLKAIAELTVGPVILTQSLNTFYQRFRRGFKRCIGNQQSAAYPITNQQLHELLLQAGLREKRRIRPFALISEEIIVVAEHA